MKAHRLSNLSFCFCLSDKTVHEFSPQQKSCPRSHTKIIAAEDAVLKIRETQYAVEAQCLEQFQEVR